MESMKELSLSEMEGISGGMGGYPNIPHQKKGFRIYQIQRGDTLQIIAQRFGTTPDFLKSINQPMIHDIHYIIPCYYIYVPE